MAKSNLWKKIEKEGGTIPSSRSAFNNAGESIDEQKKKVRDREKELAEIQDALTFFQRSGYEGDTTRLRNQEQQAVFQLESARKTYNDTAAKFINQFASDTNNFFANAANNFKNLSWESATSTDYISQMQSDWNNLQKNSQRIRDYIEENKDVFDRKQYTDLVSYLDAVNQNYASTVDAFTKAKDFYSQFESQQHYDVLTMSLEDLQERNTKARGNVAALEDAIKAEDERWGKFVNSLTDFDSPDYQKEADAHNQRMQYLQEQLDQASAPVAYTTKSGENITWEGLYELAKNTRETENLVAQYQNSENWSGVGQLADSMGDDFQELYRLMTTGVPLDQNEALRKGFTKQEYFDALNTRHALGQKYGIDLTQESYDSDKLAELTNNVNFMSELTSVMSDDEKRTLMSLFLNEGYDAAMEYYNQRRYGWEKEKYFRDNQAHTEWAKENGLEASAASVGYNALGAIETYADALRYSGTDEKYLNSTAGAANALRSGVMQSIDWNFLGTDWFDFLYGTGMSMLDSRLAMYTAGPFSPLVLSMSAAGNATNDAFLRGLDRDAAASTGLVAGIAEYLWESVSFGNLEAMKQVPASTWKDLGKNWLKSMGVNATEELATELTNIAYDTFANGDFSQFETDYRTALSNGKSESEAWNEAFSNAFWRSVEAAGSGALMGMGDAVTGLSHAATSTVRENYGNYKQQKAVADVIAADQIAVEQLQAQAKTAVDGNFGGIQKGVQKRSDKVTENASKKNVRQLYKSVQKAFNAQDQADISTALEATGMDSKKAKQLAKAIALDSRGARLTDAQNEMLFEYGENKAVQKVVRDMVVNADSSVNQRHTALNSVVSESALRQEFEKAGFSKEASDIFAKVFVADQNNRQLTKEEQDILESIEQDPTVQKAIQAAQEAESTENFTTAKQVFDNVKQTYSGVNNVIADVSEVDRAAMLQVYDQESNGNEVRFAGAMLAAYSYGYENQDIGKTSKLQDSVLLQSLTEPQKMFAWKLGRDAAMADANKRKDQLNTTYKKAQEANQAAQKGPARYGAVHDKSMIGTKLKGMRLASYMLADKIAKAVKTTVVAYKGGTEWGYYDHSTDRIHINVDVKWSEKTMMLFTLGHELVHRAKAGSPTQYQAFADFLIAEYSKRGADVDAMIAQQIKASDGQLTRDQAFDEVVADACQRMLIDTNAGQKLAQWGAQSQQNKNIVLKVVQWIKDLFANLRTYYTNVDPDSLAAQEFMKLDKQVQEQLADMFVKMSVEAGNKLSTIQEASGQEFAKEFLALKDVQYNRAVVDKHKSDLESKITKDSAVSLSTLLNRYDKLVQIWDKLGGELNSQFLQEWDSKKGTNQAFTIFKAQSGYKYNVELSSMCKKGVPLFEAIDTIVKNEVMKELGSPVLGKAEKEILYDILKQHHFEIPCAICYVEQARQREGVIIDAFLNGKADGSKIGWNQVLDQVQAEMAKAGVEYTFPHVSRDIATDKYTVKDINMDQKTQDAFYNGLMKIANEEIQRYNKENNKSRQLLKTVSPEAVKACFKGTLPANLKLFKVLFTEPISRFKIESDLLYSSKTTQNLAMAHNALYSLFNSQGGVSGYKTKQGTVVYWGDILQKKWRPEELRKTGGVRNQSNSDFQIYTLLDQAQMYMDFTAKGYYMQAYTKVLSELKLFGLSKAKINASLIPSVVVYKNADGSVNMEKTMETAGLDEKGNPIYDDVEGINHAEAFMLMQDPEYSKNIGGVCIGYSDRHIMKLLDDPKIQLIIGFHDKTNDPGKRYRGAKYAKNYNGINEAVNKAGETVHIGFNGYVKKAEGKFYYNAETESYEGSITYNDKTYEADDIPKLAADLYLEDCRKKGYAPAYNIPGIVDHQNYYKLLADFSLYNSQGHYAPHRKVAYNMPDTVPYLDANGNKQTEQTESYIKRELEKELRVRDDIAAALADDSSEGIIPQFKAEVQKMNAGKQFKRPASDSAYMDAVNRGDTKTVQKMVFEAAEKALPNSKVRDNNGNLITVYRGRVTDHNVFDKAYADITNDFGKAFYFTSSKADVEANYATEEGADLTHKINRYADKLENNPAYANLSREQIEQIAKDKYVKTTPHVLESFLNMENPVYYSNDGNSTVLDVNEFVENLEKNAKRYIQSYGEVDFSFLYDKAKNGKISAWDAVRSVIINADNELTDHNGDNAVREIIRQSLEDMGFDGVIDSSVSSRFGNLSGIDDNATHYIVFNSNQIKKADHATYDSQGNLIPLSERFNPEKMDISYKRPVGKNTQDQLEVAKERMGRYMDEVRGLKDDVKVMEKEFARIVRVFETQARRSGKKDVKIADLREALKAEAKKHRADQRVWEAEFGRLMKEYDRSGRQIEKLEEKIQQQRQAAKDKVESRKTTEVRHKIIRFKEKLQSTLQHATDNKYIPVNLIQAMVNVCELIDDSTDLYKKDGSLNQAQVAREQTMQRLIELKAQVAKIAKDESYTDDIDDFVVEQLDMLLQKFSGRSLRDMTRSELEEMYGILKGIDEAVRDARKLIGFGEMEDAYEAADAVFAEQAKITQKRKNGKRSAIGKTNDARIDYTLSPARNVERMSGWNQNAMLVKLFRELEKGVHKKDMFRMDSYKMFEALSSGKEYQDALYKPHGNQITDIHGRKFQVSKMQMMQAILSFEREVANGHLHIQKGGLKFADLDLLKKGKINNSVQAENAHRVMGAADLVDAFAQELKNDKWCQEYMTMARKFFNETAKDAINETTVKWKHRMVATEKSYIPYEVDKDFVHQEISAENNIQKTINGYGMLQQMQPNANNPIVITGLNNIIEKHIDNVSTMYGLAIPIRDFNKVWNMRSLDQSTTVKETIGANWGKSGFDHIEQAVKDIQGKRDSKESVAYKNLKSKYVGAKFMLNPSIVMKQMGSLYAARSMLQSGSMAGAVGNLFYTMTHHKEIAEEVNKYTASAWVRRQGVSDAELSSLLTETQRSLIGKAAQKLPTVVNPAKWIATMDYMVALSLWKYAKMDVAKRTGLEGEELLKATAEYYDQVIDSTQSMSDVLHRPEVQKAGNMFSDIFGMFKTDLYQMAGQLQMTAGRFMADKNAENFKALAKTVAGTMASAIWGNLMTVLFAALFHKMNPFRDDDEEVTWESIMKRTAFSFGGDVLSYFAPMLGGEFVDVVENLYYGERNDAFESIPIAKLNDIIGTIIDVATSVKEGKEIGASTFKKLITQGLEFFGVPASNAIKIFDAIKLWGEDIENGEAFSFEAGANRSAALSYYLDLAEGDTKEATRIYNEMLDEKIADGYLKHEAEDAIASELTTQIGKHYMNGQIDREDALEMLKTYADRGQDEIKKWDFELQYGFSWSQRVRNYRLGEITAEELADAVMDIEGVDEATAKTYIKFLNLEKQYPDISLTAADAEGYFKYAQPANIKVEVYMDYKTRAAQCKGEKDENGDTISGSVKEEIMDLIDSLPLSKAQKDALYLANGWAESKIKSAPWH